MIQVSVLVQPHRAVVANFVPGKFGATLGSNSEPLGSAKPLPVEKNTELYCI